MRRSKRTITKPIESSDEDDFEEVKSINRKPRATFSKKAFDAFENKENSKQNDDSSSESDIETYLTHPDELNLNSTFFKPQSKNESFDDIEKKIFSGVDRLSDSDSSETEDMPLSKVQTIENEKPRMNFEQLHEYTRKIEEAKEYVEKYMAKKRAVENKIDIKNLLAAGEKNVLESSISDLNESQLNASEYETLSDSEKEDWEEVADKVEAPKSTIPKEGVQITLEMPSIMRKKKGIDLVAAMKRRLNSIKKQNQVYIHKTHLLCWIAHGNYVNNILNDQNLLGIALSLIPSQECYPSERTNLKYLEQIVGWYRRTVKINQKVVSKKIKLDQNLSMQMDKKEAYNYKMFVYIFVCILRSLGIQCRLVFSLQLEPLRPPASELNSLSTKVEKSKEESTSKVNLSKLNVSIKNKKVVNKIDELNNSKSVTKEEINKSKSVTKDAQNKKASSKKGSDRKSSKVSSSKLEEKSSIEKLSGKSRSSKNLVEPKEETVATPNKIAKKSEETKISDKKKKSRSRIVKKVEDTIKTLESLERGETTSKINEEEIKEPAAKCKQNKKVVSKEISKIDETAKLKKSRGSSSEKPETRNRKNAEATKSISSSSNLDIDTVKKEESDQPLQQKTRSKSAKTSDKKPNLKRLNYGEGKNEILLKSSKLENVSLKKTLDVDDFVDRDTWRRSKSLSPAAQVPVKLEEVSKDDGIAEENKLKKTVKRKPKLLKIKLPMKKKKDDDIPQVDGLCNSSSDESVDEYDYYEIPRFIRQVDGADDEKPSTSKKPALKNLKNPEMECPIKKHPRRLKIDPIYKDANSEEEFSPHSPFTSKNNSFNSPPNKEITQTTLGSKIKSSKSPKPKSSDSDTNKSRFFESPKKLDIRNDIIGLVKNSIREQKHSQRKKMVAKNYKEDSDSDYAPEEIIKKKKQDDADDFVKKVKVKKRVLPKSMIESQVSSGEKNKNKVKSEKKEKEGVDVWVEVFLESEEKWICADVVQGKVHCIKEIFSKATHPISYILSWDNKNRVKDLTKRYCPNWNTVTRKLRTDPKWWEASLKPYIGIKNIRDREEDEDLARQQLDQPLPKTISEYKDHPLYVLARHLLKFQAIYPPDAVTLGFIRGEAVYSRDCVYVLHSRDIWLKSAKVVKPKEQPYKIVKARPKYDRLSNTMITDQLLEIFGEWQIEDYVPPTAENGVVPRNAYGNVDLFKACMLPKKTLHLQLPGLNKVAKKLNIDCAPAVTGFDFHSGWSHPTFDGFVVCEEFGDQLIAAWYQEQEDAEKREKEKYEKRVFGNWRRIIKGLLIRERLKARYDFGTSKPILPTTNDKKKKKK